MSPAIKVAMIGCGNISGQYLDAIDVLPDVQLVACADVVAERAAEVAAQHEGVRPLSPAEAVAADDVDVVLNLTIPSVHAEMARSALAAGKHVYGEKPLAITVRDGQAVLSVAGDAHLRVGCAPDTVLGTGLQTARAVLDRGDIGRPVAATAFFTGGGPDNWHANPAFFYQPGAGPLYDLGPYYISSLVTLLGPVRRVVSMARASTLQRRVTAGPNAGLVIDVEVDTHVSASLEHANGAISTLITSFDVRGGSTLPRIEVYGESGSLGVPDPNGFDGPVNVRRAGETDWTEVAPLAGYVDGGRGIGLADLARAVAAGEPHRASGELALHVLDVMESVIAAAHSGQAVELATTCERPAPAPLTDLRVSA